jgi:protein involved in polysaccharide export with SLBB domain
MPLYAVGLVALIGLVAGGCETNSFLDPTEPEILHADKQPLLVPILRTLDPAHETTSEFANAGDVQPDDLVVAPGDYRIGKNDLVSVSITNLVNEGQETLKTVRITDTGMINLPFIAPFKAEGLTEHELEDAITAAYKAAQLVKDTQVSVQLNEARARTFSVLGNVNSPGQYEILQSDFRILDALTLARATPEITGVDYLYVIRKRSSDLGATTRPTETNPAAPATEPAIPAPSTDLLQPRTDAGDGKPLFADVTPSTQPSGGSASSAQPFAFNAPPGTADTRVIRIPLKDLRYGALKYNIVIRPGDLLFIPQPIIGVYYMGGHVQRGGAFSLSGMDVTLKQAVIAAGMFDQNAVPWRTEVIRRIGEDQEVFVRVDMSKVWSGDEPDIFIKPNDAIVVGTDWWASFLGAVRNSFRLTYGAGFLYDRDYYNQQNVP